MSTHSRTRFAVLGMLGMNIQTGYDIKKYTESVLSHFWRESYGNLYPVLKRLEAEGLSTRRTEMTPGRPPRQMYHLTETGQAELERWLEEVSELEVPRHEVLLKLLLSAKHGPSLGLRHVLHLRAQLLSAATALASARAAMPDDPEEALRFRLTLSFGEKVNTAMLDWCDEAIGILGATPL